MSHSRELQAPGRPVETTTSAETAENAASAAKTEIIDMIENVGNVENVEDVENVERVLTGHDVAGAADTIPAAPAVRLEDDEAFQAFASSCARATAELAGREWDNLAHVEAFARAARLGADVLRRHDDDRARRRVVHHLWPLLPPPARARRAMPLRPLPDEVMARAPDFRLLPGDVPRIAPVYSAFLGRADIAASLFVPGSGPFLVPRGLCPTAARGVATAVVLDGPAEPAAPTDPKAPPSFRAHVPASTWMNGADVTDVAVRTGADGKPLLTAEGRPQPLVVGVDVLAAWLLSAGPDARGLDLRSHDDRALLLTFCRLLRGRDVRGRSAFSWLEDNEAPRGVRVDVVSACLAAAVEAVAACAADPLACRITLRPHDGDGGWPAKAAALLDDTGLFHDVHPRPATAGFARDIVWLDAFLPPGFAAGRLTSLAAGRAFARLATSVLAPLGVLPQSGMKDGSGDVLLQRLLPGPDDDSGATGVGREPPLLVSFGRCDHSGHSGHRPAGPTRPLFEAWRDGEGTALADLRNAPRHDVQQMPAWLSFFLEGVGAG